MNSRNRLVSAFNHQDYDRIRALETWADKRLAADKTQRLETSFTVGTSNSC
jgi:hypothetical protein